MRDFSKRQYLKYAGLGLAAAAVGLPGTASASAATTDGATPVAAQVGTHGGDELDYERDRDGEVRFDAYGVRFETRDGDIDLRDDGVDFETTDDRDELQLTIDRGSIRLDLDTSDRGDRVELAIAVGGEYVEFEVDDDEVEFTFAGDGDSFEDDDGRIEYGGDAISLDWDGEDRELDVDGEVRVELRTDRDLEFEYDYVGEEVTVRWEDRGRRDEFEAFRR